jgi:hypothetical protein
MNIALRDHDVEVEHAHAIAEGIDVWVHSDRLDRDGGRSVEIHLRWLPRTSSK